MFNLKFKKTEADALDLEIQTLFDQLKMQNPATDTYAATADQLVKLYTLKANTKKRVSPDVLVGAATNIAGILLISYWEQSAHIITSKAFSFIGRTVK